MDLRYLSSIVIIIILSFVSISWGASLDEWRAIEQCDTLDVFLKDKLVGTLVHSVKILNSEKSIAVKTAMSISGKSAGSLQVSLTEERFYNTDGTLKSARQTMTAPIGSNTWKLSKTARGWEYAVVAGGVTNANIIDAVSENLLPTLDIYKKIRSGGIAPGQTWADTMFEMVSGRPVASTYRCSAIDREGKTVTLAVKDDMSGRAQEWQLDMSGRTIMQELQGLFTAKRRGPQTGTGKEKGDYIDISELVDLFNVSKDRAPLENERIALVLPQDLVMDSSVADWYDNKGNTWVLTYGEKKCACTITMAPDSLVKKFTRPTITLQSDNTAISQLEKKLKAGEKDPCKIIHSFNAYVYSSLEKRNTATFSSALETLKAGFGDCGEHSVLLAALLRSAGIPARVVLGLYYYGPKKAFCGHAWVMAWAGSWVFCDPAFGVFPACKDRIPLIIDDSGRNAVLLAKFVGRLGVEYVKEEK